MSSVPLPSIKKAKKAIKTPNALHNRATLYQAACLLAPYMDHTEHHLLLVFCTFANEDGSSCSPGVSGMVKRSNYSEKVIKRVTNYLREINILISDGRGMWGQRKYRLNIPGHWNYNFDKRVNLPGLLVALPPAVATPLLPAWPALPETPLPDLPSDLPSNESTPLPDLQPNEDTLNEIFPDVPATPPAPPEDTLTDVQAPDMSETPPAPTEEATDRHEHEKRVFARMLAIAQGSSFLEPSAEFMNAAKQQGFQPQELDFIWKHCHMLQASHIYQMWDMNNFAKWIDLEWHQLVQKNMPEGVDTEHVGVWIDIQSMLSIKRQNRIAQPHGDFITLAKKLQLNDHEVDYIWRKNLAEIQVYKMWIWGFEKWQQHEQERRMQLKMQ